MALCRYRGNEYHGLRSAGSCHIPHIGRIDVAHTQLPVVVLCKQGALRLLAQPRVVQSLAGLLQRSAFSCRAFPCLVIGLHERVLLRERNHHVRIVQTLYLVNGDDGHRIAVLRGGYVLSHTLLLPILQERMQRIAVA